MLRSPTVVGRDREIAVLQRLLKASATGQGGVAVVVGEAGVGKTALVRAVLEQRRSVVARAAASAGMPLGPVVELAVGLIDGGARVSSPVMGAYRPAVMALVPELTVDAGPWRGELPQPVVLADALVRLWATMPVPQRPVLVVEDAHWLGDDTWAVVRRLCHSATGPGAVVILTSRPEGPHLPDLRRLVEARDAIDIELGPLPSVAVTQMVAACLQVSAPDVPAAVMDCTSGASGWPLLIEEVLGDLAGSGALTRSDLGWTLGPRGSRVPPTLAVSTRTRMRTLPPGQRRLIERAAVLGRIVDLDLLAASFGVDLDDVVVAVRAGVEVGVLEVDSGTGVAGFRHELLRESVLADVLDSQRRWHAAQLLEALARRPVAAVTAADVVRAAGRDDDLLALAARLATDAQRPDLAGPLWLAIGQRLLARGLPLGAAAAAETAAEYRAVRSGALACQVEALALAGEVERALAAAARLDALPGRQPTARVREAVVRATAHRGDWQQAEQLLRPLMSGEEPASTTALSALVALELGQLARAEAEARRALQLDDRGAAACQAMEVLGRLARRRDLHGAQAWFHRAVVVAEASGLVLWRARALHEEATIAHLQSLQIAPLQLARAAAVDAGAPGLVSTVDFHLAAVLGVRFEAGEALEVARRLLADARSQGAATMQAWAWILIGQAHAVGGQRAQAELAATEALACAPTDPEIHGLALGTCRGLPALLAEDSATALAQWAAGVSALRQLPAVTPLPPWYLWAVLATVADVEGDGGRRARDETDRTDLRVFPGIDALWHLACAVAAGREGDVEQAHALAATAAELLAAIPAFAGWRHLAHRWVAADATAAGWGEPATWMSEAAQWFGERGFDAAAASCRGLARKAGAPQRRRGRGASAVPPHLDRLGVTSREVDVLRLVAVGLTNAEIAERLYLSPRTVKGYVEQLLAKTGAANRTQLAARLDPDDQP